MPPGTMASTSPSNTYASSKVANLGCEMKVDVREIPGGVAGRFAPAQRRSGKAAGLGT